MSRSEEPSNSVPASRIMKSKIVSPEDPPVKSKIRETGIQVQQRIHPTSFEPTELEPPKAFNPTSEVLQQEKKGKLISFCLNLFAHIAQSTWSLS
jgi:hypothetical protein